MNTPVISDSLLKRLADRLVELNVAKGLPESWLKALMRGDVVLVVTDIPPCKIEAWPVQHGH